MVTKEGGGRAASIRELGYCVKKSDKKVCISIVIVLFFIVTVV